jgi:hypothetical protein
MVRGGWEVCSTHVDETIDTVPFDSNFTVPKRIGRFAIRAVETGAGYTGAVLVAPIEVAELVAFPLFLGARPLSAIADIPQNARNYAHSIDETIGMPLASDSERHPSHWKRNLCCVNLHRSTFGNVELSLTNMDSADFTDTKQAPGAKPNFSNSNFRLAMFRKAKLPDANFAGAFLVGADLRGANFERANFQDTDLQGAWFDENTKLPFSREMAAKMGMIFKGSANGKPGNSTSSPASSTLGH